MANGRSTIKCTIPKCRNVGKTEYEMSDTNGEEFVAGTLSYPIRQKHFVMAVEDIIATVTDVHD